MLIESDRYYPRYVALEITRRCNMNCLHCGSSADTTDRAKTLSLKEWYAVIDELIELNTKHIALSGGEPFLYPNWRDLVKYIKDSSKGCTQVNFISNGSTITEEDILFMKNMGVTHIALSIDGTEDVHNKIRRHPGSYKKILDTIKLCNKHNFPATVSTSINRINFDIREQILKNMLDLNLAIWQVQVVNSFGRAGDMKEQMVISREQYAILCEDLVRWKRQYDGKLRIVGADSIGYCDGGIVDELLEGDEWMGCNAGIYNLGIESNGNVKGCLSLQDDKFIAGNVRKRSLVEIWNDDESFWYTRKYDPTKMEGHCKNCNKAEQCMAGCLGMAYSIHKTTYENSYCYKTIRGL